MPKHEITLSQAIEGYFIYANALRLSPHTLDNYHWALSKLEAYLESDPALTSITTADIRAFVNNLPSLSNKSIINVRSGLSALWTWALREGLAPRNIIKDTQAPKPEKRAIVPFTQRDIQLLLAACDRSKVYRRPGKRACPHKRLTSLRDRAIVMLMLDTGIRSSELCTLTIRNTDLKAHHIVVTGKGNKQRHIPLSPRTEQAIWHYLTTREVKRRADPPFSQLCEARQAFRSEHVRSRHSVLLNGRWATSDAPSARADRDDTAPARQSRRFW